MDGEGWRGEGGGVRLQGLLSDLVDGPRSGLEDCNITWSPLERREVGRGGRGRGGGGGGGRGGEAGGREGRKDYVQMDGSIRDHKGRNTEQQRLCGGERLSEAD